MQKFTFHYGGENLDIDTSTSNRLGKGGEASVYRTSKKSRWKGKDLVAKIYAQPLQETTLAKLKIMVTSSSPMNSDGSGHMPLAWPEDILDDAYGAPCGYVMQSVAGADTLYALIDRSLRNAAWPGLNWNDLLTVSRGVAEIFNALHKTNKYVIGDAKDDNIMVHLKGPDKGKVTLIDVDSIQVTSSDVILHCPVVTPGFTPPEAFGKDLSRWQREPSGDLFGLSVLLFRLLIWSGYHPFSGDMNHPEFDDAVKNGGQYFFDNHSTQLAFTPRPDLLLGNEIDKLFRRCFVDGRNQPANRPAAEEWLDAIARAQGNLMTCANDNRHVYLRTASECPFCELENRGKKPVRVKKPVSSPGQQLPVPLSGSPKPNLPTGAGYRSPVHGLLSQAFAAAGTFLAKVKTVLPSLTSLRNRLFYVFGGRRLGLPGIAVGSVLLCFSLLWTVDNYASLRGVTSRMSYEQPGEKVSVSPPPDPAARAAELEQRGDAEYRQENLPQALEFYRRAYDLWPTVNLQRKINRFQSQYGNQAQPQSQPQSAAAMATEFVALGDERYRLGDHDGAYENYRQAYIQAPTPAIQRKMENAFRGKKR